MIKTTFEETHFSFFSFWVVANAWKPSLLGLRSTCNALMDDLVHTFEAWFEGELDFFRSNFPMITLIPKEGDVGAMKNFRHIILLNCCFKIFTKLLTNGLSMVIGILVFEQQSIFCRQGSTRRESVEGRPIFLAMTCSWKITLPTYRPISSPLS